MKFLSWASTSFFLAFCVGCTGCSSLFYYPDSNMYYRPEKLAVVPKQIELKDRKDRKIVGWYFKNKIQEKPKAKILFFHGNAQNISSHFASLYWILDHGYDFYIFDYPGYGGSEGDPTRDSVVESGYTALKWISQTIDPQIPLAVFGQSLGGNISLYTLARYQKEFPICQITVESTFYSYPQVGRTVLAANAWTWPLQWLPYLLVTNYKSASENLKQISPTPLLVMHGEKDPVVDILNGQRVYEEAREPKEFLKVREGTHIDAFAGTHKDEYQKKYLEVLKKNCGG